MASQKYEEKMKKALHQGTDKATNKMQEKNWKRIRERIDKMEERNMPKTDFKWRKIIGIGTAAAVMALSLGIFTQPGQAALEKIRQYFEPEKIVEYEVEGSKENINSRLQQGEIGYVMYYDQERYKVIEEGQTDRYVMKEAVEGVPDVYLEVSQDTDSTPKELAAKLESELKADFSRVDSFKEVTEPLDALYIHAIDGGNQSDDPIVEYYLVDNTTGGTFIIKAKYFLEAAEGHGARFHNMLKEFRIVSVE